VTVSVAVVPRASELGVTESTVGVTTARTNTSKGAVWPSPAQEVDAGSGGRVGPQVPHEHVVVPVAVAGHEITLLGYERDVAAVAADRRSEAVAVGFAAGHVDA
jgi:hypothetical protein